MYLGLPGNALGSHWMSERKCPGRGKSVFLYSNGCPHDLATDKDKEDRQMDGMTQCTYYLCRCVSCPQRRHLPQPSLEFSDLGLKVIINLPCSARAPMIDNNNQPLLGMQCNNCTLDSVICKHLTFIASLFTSSAIWLKLVLQSPLAPLFHCKTS